MTEKMSDYGPAYWDRLDNGQGYQDSVMWQDLAFITHHIFANGDNGVDLAGSLPHIDVGCAFGFMIRHMRRRGFESFGLDYSQYSIDNAPPDVAEHIRWFDLSGRNDSFFGKERFKLLTCFETLEHIEANKAYRAITHLWNLLEPGGSGLITICTPEVPNWQSDPTHINVVSRDWWTPRFAERGFTFRDDLVQDLKAFHLFKAHPGVFVVEKPA